MSTEISRGLARWRQCERNRSNGFYDKLSTFDPALLACMAKTLDSRERGKGREIEQFDLSAEQTVVTTPEVEQPSVLPTENAKESKPRPPRQKSVKNTGNSSANTGAVI